MKNLVRAFVFCLGISAMASLPLAAQDNKMAHDDKDKMADHKMSSDTMAKKGKKKHAKKSSDSMSSDHMSDNNKMKDDKMKDTSK